MSNSALASCLRCCGFICVFQQEATSCNSCWHHIYIIMAMCPIAHVPHCSCGLLPMYPITLLPCRPRRDMPHCPYALSLLFPITHMPNHPTPCAHVPHCSCGRPCTPLPYCHVDLEGHMPHCPYAPSPLFP